MSEPPYDPAIDEIEVEQTETDRRMARWLEAVVGELSLDNPSFAERGHAVMAALEGLTGNDCLWVLATIVGNVLADAPPERRRPLLVAIPPLIAYSLDRAEVVKAAVRHHEEGHA